MNFDTLECGSCRGYVQVIWAANEFSNRDGLHDYRAQPWPLKLEKHTDHWPAAIRRYWLQAKRNIKDDNWDAAAVMAKSALQIALRNNNARGSSMRKEIENLTAKGMLRPIMKEWSDRVRDLGNDSAHPNPDQAPTKHSDARDIVRCLDFLLECLYSLPHEIEFYRDRAAPGKKVVPRNNAFHGDAIVMSHPLKKCAKAAPRKLRP